MAISGASTDPAWTPPATRGRAGLVDSARPPAGPQPESGTPAGLGASDGRRARLRSALGIALLPFAFAATLVWLVFLLWLAVVLVDLPFR